MLGYIRTMSEQEFNEPTEKVLRGTQVERTIESTADDAVIAGDRQGNQIIHQKASEAGKDWRTHSDNDDDQSFTAMKEGETLEQYQARTAHRPQLEPSKPKVDPFGIDFGDGTMETSKGTIQKPHTQKFFESKAQSALTAIKQSQQEYQPDQLIAANVPPPIHTIESAREFQEIKTDGTPAEVSDTIAWNSDIPESLVSPIVLLPDYLIGDLVKQLGDVQKAIDSLPDHPCADHEFEVLEQTTKDDPKSWIKAQSLFPELKNVDPNLMKAITLNELNFYDKVDLAEDVLAEVSEKHPKVKESIDDKTLGMTQITPKGLRDMCDYFPQLKEFIKEKGYTGKEQMALLDPACVPMIMAAKTALIVRDLNRNQIPINSENIAYSYNADVYSYSDGHGGKVYECLKGPIEVNKSKLFHWDQIKEYYANDPNVAQKSEHLGNVKRWLNKLK